jgi:hypothetical protein
MKTKLFHDLELQAFQTDGFIVVPGLYTEREVEELCAWCDELCQRGPVVGKEMFYYEDSLLEPGKKILSRIENFIDYDERFRAFIEDERLSGRLAELLEAEPILFKEKINFKRSGGDGFKPHQDIQPGWDDYAPYFISVLVTMDASTVENGCLELSAGHHKKGLLGERWKPLTEEQLAGVEFTKYPMKPGDVAFFDCFVPHQSGPNLTGKQRRNLYLTYNRASDGDSRQKYYSDKRKSYPPDNERDADTEYKFRV